jgi:hypothetical protein
MLLQKTPPAYEAVSYTWGDPKGPWSEIPDKRRLRRYYNIRVNGQMVTIGFNLRAALRRFRDRTEVKTIWVDAICIDQKTRTRGVSRSRRWRGFIARLLASYAGWERKTGKLS